MKYLVICNDKSAFWTEWYTYENMWNGETEIFEEIISMLHCFAMKMYSRRRKRKLELIKEDLKNEISL